MAVKRISITEFVSMMEQYPILDVRSPLEYAHAHMKNAYSLPLFSDEERKVVGALRVVIEEEEYQANKGRTSVK
jgi:tRNA 2-selenouridine synthase